MSRVFIRIKQVVSSSLRLLQRFLLKWTEPPHSSLLIGAVIDLHRGKVAATSSIKLLKTPFHAPRANAMCERFLGSVRRECLDQLLLLQEKQLQRVLNAYVEDFNRARPHQGLRQQLPEPSGGPVPPDHEAGKSSPSRSWVDDIMTTADVLAFLYPYGKVGD